LHNLDVNFIKFDNFLNISKAEFNKNQSTINLNIDDNLDSSNEKNFNDLMKEINKKTKYENIKEKNFINLETIELRKNIHEEIIKNFDNININNNLSYHQYEALINYKKNKYFKVIDCDKNIGSAIISNQLYMESVFNYINADTAYRELDFDPLSETVNLINNKLEELCSNNHISTKMKKTLRINESLSKLGSIRLMAKMHKKTSDWRAIINFKRHPTSKISVFF
jgi:hypothetical protein